MAGDNRVPLRSSTLAAQSRATEDTVDFGRLLSAAPILMPISGLRSLPFKKKRLAKCRQPPECFHRLRYGVTVSVPFESVTA